MLFTEIISVYSKNSLKSIYALYRQNAVILFFKQGVHTVSSLLENVSLVGAVCELCSLAAVHHVSACQYFLPAA